MYESSAGVVPGLGEGGEMGKVEGKGKGGESKRKKGNMRYESKAKQIRTGIQGCQAPNGAGIGVLCRVHCMSGAIRI